MVILAPEAIVFGTLFAVPLIWMVLKIFVNRVMNSERPPRRAAAKNRAA